MPGPVENYALLSIARGCGFAGLAVACGMVGMAFDPPGALKLGGFAGSLACAILILMALRSEAVAYKKTETWLMLPEEIRPPPPVAQFVVGRARRRALLYFAQLTAGFSAFCFVGAFLLRAWIGT